MTVAVSKAVEEGAEAVICASTGNTAASCAAYAARAGIPAVVLTPEGAVAGPKVAQTRMLGAKVLEVRGDFDHALAAARELADRGTHVLVNSVNPNRRAGQKTAVFEIVEELGGAPDAFVIPYGGGGNTSAYSSGISRARARDADLLRRGGAPADDDGLGDPDRRSRPCRERARVGRDRDHGFRRRDRGRLARARSDGRDLLRALVRRRPRGDPARRCTRASGSPSRSPATGSRTPAAPTGTRRRSGRWTPTPTRSRPQRAHEGPGPRDVGEHRCRGSTPPPSRSTSGTSSR